MTARFPMAKRLAGLITLGWLAASAPAQATTLAYQNYAQGSQVVTITNAAPASSGTYAAGEMLFGKNDGGVVSTLSAFCVDIFQYASSAAQEYTLVDGVAHFGAERTLALSHLFSVFDVFNGSTAVTAEETGAMQMAIWEIVNEVAVLNGGLQFDLATGGFKASAVNSSTTALAQTFLNGLSTAGNGYKIGVYESASYQDYLVATKIPEPGSTALMLGALGAMGWVARRRKANVG